MGMVTLPTYTISHVAGSKKYMFQAKHETMRTYVFQADTEEDMRRWMKAMTLATQKQS